MESHSSHPRARGLGQTLSKNNNFSQHQIYIIQVLGATSATVSIVCGIVTIYWFLRMRRSFRHHLIMLLLFSDFFKAVWYLIFPVANFVQGSIPTASTLCQVDGFMTAFGFEATDFAILVIAVHSAICIFAGRLLRGEAGLYRYRWYAYGSWIAFATLMAGLAFVNHDHAYLSQGTFCYLPVRPFWYRLALSWIPRYIILATITGLYIAIYWYVKVHFRQLGKETRDSYLGSISEDPRTTTTNRTARESNYASEPNSPMPESHSLSGSTARESTTRKGSRLSTSESPSWERYTFGSRNPIPSSEIVVQANPAVPAPVTFPSSRKASATSSMTNRSSKRVSIGQALRDMRVNSVAPVPRKNSKTAVDPTLQPDVDPDPTRIAACSPVPDPFVVTALRRRHRAIKRQVRFLFIYPLVYMVVWALPFVSHCLQYSDHFSKNPPFILQCLSTSILCLQCAVDCCLFSIREKPWRHIDSLNIMPPVFGHMDYNHQIKTTNRARSGKFWPSLRFWKISVHQPGPFELSSLRRPVPVPGREKVGQSKAERVWEGTIARRRRDIEEAGNRESWRALAQKRRESDERRGGRDRQWWEEEGKKRKDSVLLGTDGSKDVPVQKFHPADNGVRNPTIMEEGGEAPDASENNDDDGVGGASPRNSRRASAFYDQELKKAREEKKPTKGHPRISSDLDSSNAESLDLIQHLSRPRPSDADIDWAAVYADDDWRNAVKVEKGKMLGKTKAELEADTSRNVDAKATSNEGTSDAELDIDDGIPHYEGDNPLPTLPPLANLPELEMTGSDKNK